MTKTIIPSPIGDIVILCDTGTLVSVSIAAPGGSACGDTPAPGSIEAEASEQIRAYFDGRLHDFTLPLAPVKTPRGQALREAMMAIPYGETLSYGALARIAQSGPRAIGQACARNRLPIIVPCHRVTGSGGQLGHYSGGDGIKTKSWLLDHENGGRLI